MGTFGDIWGSDIGLFDKLGRTAAQTGNLATKPFVSNDDYVMLARGVNPTMDVLGRSHQQVLDDERKYQDNLRKIAAREAMAAGTAPNTGGAVPGDQVIGGGGGGVIYRPNDDARNRAYLDRELNRFDSYFGDEEIEAAVNTVDTLAKFKWVGRNLLQY